MNGRHILIDSIIIHSMNRKFIKEMVFSCGVVLNHGFQGLCGNGGGFAMDTSALLDEAKPENVKVMFEFPKENSVYG